MLYLCEAKIIKRALQVPNNSYNTELYECLGIKSLDWAIKKWKITFFKQLIENSLTWQLLETRSSSMEVMFAMLEIREKTHEENSQDFKQRVWSRCIEEIQRINQLETKSQESPMTATLRRLFKEREEGENEEILLLLLCAKNKMRNIAEEQRLAEEPG